MKTIVILILTLLALPSCSKASETAPSKNIQIHVRQEWRIQITPKGRISIHSSGDSNPMANAHTSEKVTEFHDILKLLTDDVKSFPDGGEARKKSVWAQIPGMSEKIAVSEESLFKILETASKHWEFPGLTTRITERLEKQPILQDIKKQNKALHPTDGAVVPENPKE